jgi:hypothetical protein
MGVRREREREREREKDKKREINLGRISKKERRKGK